MNYIKLQKHILDNYLKNGMDFNAQEQEDIIIVKDDNYELFIFPKEQFYLDLNKMMHGKSPINMHPIIKGVDGEDGVLTDEMKVITKKQVAVKVASKNNHTWIDKKFLDRFGIKEDDLHFTIGDKRTTPVLVWEGEVLCGLIIPIFIKEDDK